MRSQKTSVKAIKRDDYQNKLPDVSLRTASIDSNTHGIGGKSSADAFFSRRGRLETDLAKVASAGRIVFYVLVLRSLVDVVLEVAESNLALVTHIIVEMVFYRPTL